MAQLPAHASPAFSSSTAPQPSRTISDYHLQSQTSTPAPSDTASDSAHDPIPSDHREALRDAFSSSGRAVPSFISPAITPPATPGGTSIPTTDASPARQATGTQTPDLVEQLPEVECIVRARIPTTSAHELFLHVYHNNVDNKEHLAIVFGNHIRSRSLDAPRPGETEMDRMIRGAYEGRLFPGRTTSRVDQLRREAGVPTTAASSVQQEEHLSYSPLVRIHSECYTGETVWSARCDCGEQLDEAARQMSAPESGGGVIIYLRQEGRGIGLGEKLKAYNLQDLGNDTYEANLLLRHPADARSYGLATAMLVDLGLGGADGIRLLTNNPDKVRAVEGPRREVVVRDRVPMVPLSWKSNGQEGVHGPELEKYLSTKIEKFKHLFSN